MLKSNLSNPNFSEKSLSWFTYQFQGPIDAEDDELEGVYNNDFNIFNPQGFDSETNVYNDGASFAGTAPSQLSTWLGASTEEQVPYINANGDLVEVDGNIIASELGDWTLDYYDLYNNAFHLQNSQLVDGPYFTGVTVEKYVPDVKDLMLNNGSVSVSYHALESDTSPYENNYFNNQTYSQYIPSW